MSQLRTFSPGYNPLFSRAPHVLADDKAFNILAVVGLDTAGKITPFLSGTVSGIQYAYGLLDPAVVLADFTSGTSQSASTVSGIISLVNGTSSNAFVQANVGAYAYTADGLTANATASTNPLPVSGTAGGKLLGTFLGFDPSLSGNVLVSVVPELNSGSSNSTGDMTLAGVQTVTGAKTFAASTLKQANSGGTFSTTFASAATAARTFTLPNADATAAQAAVASASTTPGAGGGTAPAFTGTAPASAVNFASPSFSGTGMTASGQNMTSTDNQTMTLNQCTGMWLISATHGPYMIASNTAVTGAPAVLTIYGGAPTTDAGTYKIITGVTPVGSVASHTHTGAAHTHTQT